MLKGWRLDLNHLQNGLGRLRNGVWLWRAYNYQLWLAPIQAGSHGGVVGMQLLKRLHFNLHHFASAEQITNTTATMDPAATKFMIS
jgi:hypothetical protein